MSAGVPWLRDPIWAILVQFPADWVSRRASFLRGIQCIKCQPNPFPAKCLRFLFFPVGFENLAKFEASFRGVHQGHGQQLFVVGFSVRMLSKNNTNEPFRAYPGRLKFDRKKVLCRAILYGQLFPL